VDTDSTYNLADWVRVEELPWSDWFVYRLLKNYPQDVKTAVLCASPGGKGRGIRMISKSSIAALLSRLADEQSADVEGRKERLEAFKAFREGRSPKKENNKPKEVAV
jgi:hypothetical protein